MPLGHDGEADILGHDSSPDEEDASASCEDKWDTDESHNAGGDPP